MSNQKFDAGAWVKEKTGTKGMTVVRYVSEGSDSENVICKYADEEGHDVEGEFPEADLISLDDN
ncbi:hypothetical protein [Dyadobacter sp. CY356]|uniref:hypothetical protein n=1 Tax=Dyadobacter sp. CY356 TaxID=2906442 RepID=UPI001F2CE604|nr:hypothetical protein [Dyadobacter sp. CY356]MCF0057069.1 hypothetical protein [Dyadobacter sp. CY356]